MARTNTALSLKGVNNKFNKLHEFTKQDHERKRSANGTNLTTATRRKLRVKFVVKTKNKVDDKRPFVVNGLFVANTASSRAESPKAVSPGYHPGLDAWR